MADTQDDSQQPEADVLAEATPEAEVQLAPEKPLTAPGSDVAAGAAPGSDMSVNEMREWLRNWIGNATGQSPDSINESAPMVELGLSSRDAVAMASDIEDLTGVTLTATVAFRHPTIESLATVIIEGEPELEQGEDDEDWSRDDTAARDIAIVGLATRFPGDMNTPTRRGRRCSRAATRSATCPRAAGRSSSASRASPSGSPSTAPAAATCPTSRASTPNSSRCRRWRPTTSIRSSGWRSS